MTRDLKSWALDWLKSPQLNYINGEWREGTSGQEFERENPANGEVISRFQMAGQSLVADHQGPAPDRSNLISTRADRDRSNYT